MPDIERLYQLLSDYRSSRPTIFGHVWPAGVALAAFVVGGLMVALPAYFLARPTPREIAACDQAVKLFLTTRDPIELQRATVMIETMRCDIGRRMAVQPSSP